MILEVSHEEMLHLHYVQTLLRSLGERPEFALPGRDPDTDNWIMADWHAMVGTEPVNDGKGVESLAERMALVNVPKGTTVGWLKALLHYGQTVSGAVHEDGGGPLLEAVRERHGVPVSVASCDRDASNGRWLARYTLGVMDTDSLRNVVYGDLLVLLATDGADNARFVQRWPSSRAPRARAAHRGSARPTCLAEARPSPNRGTTIAAYSPSCATCSSPKGLTLPELSAVRSPSTARLRCAYALASPSTHRFGSGSRTAPDGHERITIMTSRLVGHVTKRPVPDTPHHARAGEGNVPRAHLAPRRARRLAMRTSRCVLVALLLVLAVSAPASAGPPERTEDPWFGLTLDVRHELVAFWNITRANYCAWEESGSTGAPPVERLVPAQYIETANGAVVAKISATSTLELWALDADADFSGACADTDDSSVPWAVGSAHVTGNDNDLFVSGSRTNSFGDRGRGNVWDASGAGWRYVWTFRALIDGDFEFRAVVDHSTLAGGQ